MTEWFTMGEAIEILLCAVGVALFLLYVLNRSFKKKRNYAESDSPFI
jgi:hypothetical protein